MRNILLNRSAIFKAAKQISDKIINLPESNASAFIMYNLLTTQKKNENAQRKERARGRKRDGVKKSEARKKQEIKLEVGLILAHR